MSFEQGLTPERSLLDPGNAGRPGLSTVARTLYRGQVLAIEAHQLTKIYGDYAAVNHLDLSVTAGTVASLLGPNGAGKTTVVRMLATLIAPSSGSATVCGHDIVKDPDGVRGAMSLTGQFAAMEDNLTARENLLLMAQLRGYHRQAAARVADSLIDRFDMGDFRDKLVKSVSGGQRRRVDLAASLVVQPQLLVLDEPTTGLDPRSRQAVWSTVRDLVNEGITLLLTTQYLDEADALADHVVLIDHGRATASGTPTDLKAQIGGQRVDVTAVDSAGFGRLAEVLGAQFTVTETPERRMISIPAPGQTDELAAVTAAVNGSGVDIDEIALRRPTLDDAFLALTGQPLDAGRHDDHPTELDATG